MEILEFRTVQIEKRMIYWKTGKTKISTLSKGELFYENYSRKRLR